MRTNNRITFQRIKARTNEIKVGATYFLSSFYDKDGGMVKVTAKSTKKNSCGWPSSVEYTVISKIGDGKFYTPGRTGTCNATNLYENREDASHKVKFNRNAGSAA